MRAWTSKLTAAIHPMQKYLDLGSVPPYRPIRQHPLIERLRLAVSFDHVAIMGLDLEGYTFEKFNSVDSDFPPAFLDAYAADDLGRSDPLSIAALDGLIISDAKAWERQPPSQRLVYLLDHFGLQNRTIFPIRRGNLVYGAVCLSRTNPFSEEEMTFIQQAAPLVHHQITKDLMMQFAASELRLRKSEIDCLERASIGLTSEEIAASTGLSVFTVNNYIKSATVKLDCTNRAHAIAELIRRRLIE